MLEEGQRAQAAADQRGQVTPQNPQGAPEQAPQQAPQQPVAQQPPAKQQQPAAMSVKPLLHRKPRQVETRLSTIPHSQWTPHDAFMWACVLATRAKWPPRQQQPQGTPVAQPAKEPSNGRVVDGNP